MKRLIPILLSMLMFTSCIKDDIDACAGKMHFYFNYIYGGRNRFFEMETTDLNMHFYKNGSSVKYRQMTIDRSTIDIQKPLLMDKTPEDTDSLELVLWSTDDRLDYVNTPETPLGEGYVHLKEITAGSGICRPVDDLFYAREKIDAGERGKRLDQNIYFKRAVSRIRITMIPKTVQTDGSTPSIIPHPEDYTFHLVNTRNVIDDNNITKGDKIILQPECYYDEKSGNVMTNWFGAFSSMGEYLYVDVYIRERHVASFDCEPIKVESVPGDYVDLKIDGKQVRPQLSVIVNGWDLAPIYSNM